MEKRLPTSLLLTKLSTMITLVLLNTNQYLLKLNQDLHLKFSNQVTVDMTFGKTNRRFQLKTLKLANTLLALLMNFRMARLSLVPST